MALTQLESSCCGGDCAECGPAEAGAGNGLRGWRMALAAGHCFLLPVLLAAAGAVWFGPLPAGQVLGAAAGLTVGILMAAVAMRFIVPSEEKP